jgi:hypothetical protein
MRKLHLEDQENSGPASVFPYHPSLSLRMNQSRRTARNSTATSEMIATILSPSKSIRGYWFSFLGAGGVLAGTGFVRSSSIADMIVQ